MECEYGYGPVTPCRIYLGSQEIGMVDTSGGANRKLVQEYYAERKAGSLDYGRFVLQLVHGGTAESRRRGICLITL